MCGIEYLELKEVAKKLKRSSVDTAVRWCFDNGISILKLGTLRVVSEYEFRLAYEKPLIDHLKLEHKDKWLDYYNAYNSENVSTFHSLQDAVKMIDSTGISFNQDVFLNGIGYGKS